MNIDAIVTWPLDHRIWTLCILTTVGAVAGIIRGEIMLRRLAAMDCQIIPFPSRDVT
ncbi:MAG: hypothetical protein NVSMB4_20300 [Acidimicrobiales bacterium]